MSLDKIKIKWSPIRRTTRKLLAFKLIGINLVILGLLKSPKKYDFDVALGGNFRIYCEHENIDSFQVLTMVNLVSPMVCLCIKLTPNALTTILFWFVHFDVCMSST
jgi:hypothetical protein